MVQCRIEALNTLAPYRFIVNLARYRGQWLFVRHCLRNTWETAGGHIEPGETPLEAAKRELYEETGAIQYTIAPAFDYFAWDEAGSASGQVFFVEVEELGDLPPSEIGEVACFDELPEALTYPGITPMLIAHYMTLQGELRMIALRSLAIHAEPGAYPFNSAQVLSLRDMRFPSPITFLVGDNGSGKSTLLEALACCTRLPAIGSADVAQDESLRGLLPLVECMRLTWTRRTHRGFFLRAEDFFGFTRRIERMQAEYKADLARVEEENAHRSAFAQAQARMAYASSFAALRDRYGEVPDAASHGEAFLNMFAQRIQPGGLYLLDEPEAALSPLRQLSLLTMLQERAGDSQFIIATHSPVLMAYPGATIYSFDEVPVRPCAYEELEHVRILRDFLHCPARYLTRLGLKEEPD